MTSSYTFNRVEFIKALQGWCNGRYNPKIAFPDKDGYQNVAYLYDDSHEEIKEKSRQMMSALYEKLGIPVMVFVEAPDRITNTALTCNEWLNLMK